MAGHYTGVGYVSGSSPKVNSGGSITGSTQYKSGIDDPTVSYVLGVSTSELKMLADYVVTDTSLLPSDMDGTKAEAGVKNPLYVTTLSSYNWSVGALPKGSYILRVEAYRAGTNLHYSYDQFQLYLHK